MTEIFKPFIEAKLKASRGKQHILNLECAIDAFRKTGPFCLFIKERPDHKAIVTIGMTQYVPPEISLIYGDAVHCLRSSLDLLACNMVALQGGKTDHVFFPFSKDKEELEDHIKNRAFKRAGPVAANLVRGFAPYWGGNDILRSLSELDNASKHRLILPIFVQFNIGNMQVVFENNKQATLEDVTIDAGVDFGFPSMPTGIHGWKSITMELVISRESPRPVHDKPLIETLNHLSTMIDKIIIESEKELTGKVESIPEEKVADPARQRVFITKLTDRR